MTIAVGVLATHSVVLAADTQLTIPNYWKGEGGKIMAIQRRAISDRVDACCAITGATNVYEYLHALGDELSKDFVEGLDVADKDRAYVRFARLIRRFYRRHILPFKAEQLTVEVVLGYQRDGVTALWQSSRNALIEKYDHGAVGIGAHAAESWLSRVWNEGLDTAQAVMMAVFAVAAAKDSVDGCGKYTQVLVVEANRFRRLPRALVDEIDDLYVMFASEISPSVISDCLGSRLKNPPTQSLEDFKGKTGSALQKLRDATPDYVTRWRLKEERRRPELQVLASTIHGQSDEPPSQE